MSDSFMVRRQKKAVAGSQITLVQTYSRDAGLQLILKKTEYEDNSAGWSCTIEMCQGHSEKNDSGKGYKTMCNWKDEKIVISLSSDELAMFTKYKDSYFLRRLGMPKPTYDMKTGKAVENNGRPVYETDKQGNPVVYGENLFHSFDGKSSILKLFKNKMNPMGVGISLTKDGKTVTMYMDENVSRKFFNCCELAMEKLVMEDVYTFKYGSGSNSGYNSGYSKPQYSQRKAPEESQQYKSYRSRMTEPEEVPDLPPMDVDALASMEEDIDL